MNRRRLLGIGAAAAASNAALAQGTTTRRPGTARTAPPPSPPPTAPGEVDPLTLRARQGVTGIGKRVLALYYPWYGTPERSGRWLHQEGALPGRKSLQSHAHYPATGPYDSTDPAVIDRHLAQAKAAGIDTLVCSWWGRKDPTDKALRALLPRAAAQRMTVSLAWERLERPGSRDAALEELTYLLDTFGKSPGFLLETGRPVLFLVAPVCQALPAPEWAWVLGEANRRYAPGLLALGDGPFQADMLLWDGLYTLGHTGRMHERSAAVCARVQAETFQVPILLARRAERLSVVTLVPGHDDRKSAAPGKGVVLEREEGRIYNALWAQAMKDNPDWLLINSFNQWHVGTEIEPSVEHGDQYLRLTADWAAKFKARRGQG